MSLIAVHGFAPKCTLLEVVKTLARPIHGHFEALNFKPQNTHSPGVKTCYVRLSERLDPARVVEKINEYSFPGQKKYKASVLEKMPDIQLREKGTRMPLKIRAALGIPDEDDPAEVPKLVTDEILIELQSKYPGLYSLSKRSNHKLLQEIAKKILGRVQEIATRSGETCYAVSSLYRRAHPHFCDFQLILAAHRELTDAGGARLELHEAELAAPTAAPQVLGLPFEKLQPMASKYSKKIVTKMTEHIEQLDSDIRPRDPGDVVARKQVRNELKRFTPFLESVINDVMRRSICKHGGSFCRMRIYGEPSLPNKDILTKFLQRYKAVHISRSTRMYNLLKFNVPRQNYYTLIAMNATVISGATLVIRSSEMMTYTLSALSDLDNKSPTALKDEDPSQESLELEDSQHDEWGTNGTEWEVQEMEL
ncbi:uncharacterized protein LOC142984132 [Anticarsia gemmatalis]|uniref:uncharacterized protein LOC142984132 n=1 Tax=Anticarsia gemmatalis TaxID=129554 RepID=UPI003F774A0B